MSAPSPESIVFDLDGTLVDTAPDLTRALNEALTGSGFRSVDHKSVRNMVGRGARVLIERALAFQNRQAAEPELQLMFDKFLSFYEANIASQSRPFDPIENVLRGLKSRGAKLGICTNKPEHLTLKLLRELDLGKHFDAVLGADSKPYRKPDPRHLLDTISQMGGQAHNAVLIGDSDTDVKTARAAQIPIILVSFGYSEAPPESLGADILINNFSELESALSRLSRA